MRPLKLFGICSYQLSVVWKRSLVHQMSHGTERHAMMQSFLLAISQFTFIVALVLTQKVLAYTKGLSVKLQGRYVDVVYAHRQVKGVKDTLKRALSRVDNFHDLVYKKALALSLSVSVDESVPRFASRQQHRQNIPSCNA